MDCGLHCRERCAQLMSSDVDAGSRAKCGLLAFAEAARLEMLTFGAKAACSRAPDCGSRCRGFDPVTPPRRYRFEV